MKTLKERRGSLSVQESLFLTIFFETRKKMIESLQGILCPVCGSEMNLFDLIQSADSSELTEVLHNHGIDKMIGVGNMYEYFTDLEIARYRLFFSIHQGMESGDSQYAISTKLAKKLSLPEDLTKSVAKQIRENFQGNAYDWLNLYFDSFFDGNLVAFKEVIKHFEVFLQYGMDA